MAFSAVLTREHFIAWLAGRHLPNARKLTGGDATDVTRAHVMLVWDQKQEDPRPISQPLVVVPSPELREFFSFVATYVPAFTPFTAFFRVVSSRDLPDLLQAVDVDIPAQRLAIEGLVGVVLAEARAQSGERVASLSDVGIQTCLATFSAPALRLLFHRQLSGPTVRQVADRWQTVRRRLGDENLRLHPESLADFWTMLACLTGSGSTTDATTGRVIQFAAEVASSPPDANPVGWGAITQGLPATFSALSKLRESREERVRALDQVIPEMLSADSVPVRVREVVCAYFVSRVAGGSMKYFQMLNPMESKLPLASLWFGFFSSVRPDSDALAIADSLGGRVARILARPFCAFDPPDADISVDELDAVGLEQKGAPRFRTEHPSYLNVDLAPGVSGTFRMPRDSRSQTPEPPAAFDRDTLREARYLLERVARALDRLEHPDQPGLFGNRPTRPRGRSRKD